MVVHSDIEFLHEPFSDQELETLKSIYIDYRVTHGFTDSWLQAWSQIYDDLDVSITCKAREKIPRHYKLEKARIFSNGLRNQVGDSWIYQLDKEIADPIFMLKKLLGQEKANRVINLFKKYFIDEHSIRKANPSISMKDYFSDINVREISERVQKSFNDEDAHIIKRISYFTGKIKNRIEKNISNEELNGEGVYDPFEIIRDEYGAEVSQTLISMIKKEMFGQFITGKPLPDIIEALEPVIKAKTPEMLHDDLFRRSWNLLCLVILPRYFDDHEKQIFEKRPFSGKHDYAIVPADKISNRLGAGGISALAKLAAETPSGADGHSPRERAEFRQPKPATRKP